MRSLILLCVLALIGLAMADTQLHPRGCIYINGRCSRDCEVGTHAYTTGCSHLKPEPTCEEPNPVVDTRGVLCDFSSCYCDPPTVRDTVSKNCIPLEQCPKKE